MFAPTFTVNCILGWKLIDNTKLIDKLHYHSIDGKELEIFKSFLSDRTQFVKIDTFTSTTKNSPNCSVIQGGKLSGTLYSLYTNEIPLLHKTMNNKWYMIITNKIYKIYKI